MPPGNKRKRSVSPTRDWREYKYSHIMNPTAWEAARKAAISGVPLSDGPQVTYRPVCAPVPDFGPFKWPDIQKLCYLDPAKVAKYEREHCFQTIWLEPILRQQGAKTNHGYDWPGILEVFDQFNPGYDITTWKSMSTTYTRSCTKMRETINEHNDLARRSTLKQRAIRTRQFLKLRRRGADPDYDPEHQFVPGKLVLVYPEGTPEDEMADEDSDEEEAQEEEDQEEEEEGNEEDGEEGDDEEQEGDEKKDEEEEEEDNPERDDDAGGLYDDNGGDDNGNHTSWIWG